MRARRCAISGIIRRCADIVPHRAMLLVAVPECLEDRRGKGPMCESRRTLSDGFGVDAAPSSAPALACVRAVLLYQWDGEITHRSADIMQGNACGSSVTVRDRIGRGLCESRLALSDTYASSAQTLACEQGVMRRLPAAVSILCRGRHTMPLAASV